MSQRVKNLPAVQELLLLSRCSRVRLCATPWTAVHQAPLSMGILQAKILEWVTMAASGGLPNIGIEPKSFTSPALAGRFFTTGANWKARWIIFISFLGELICLWLLPVICKIFVIFFSS